MSPIQSDFLSDIVLGFVMCLSLGGAAVLIGFRIGSERMIKPLIDKDKAMAQLDDENIEHIKSRYLAQRNAWRNVLALAFALANVNVAGFLSYHAFVAEPHGVIAYGLALLMVTFFAAIGSTGYQLGARLGLMNTFMVATETQMVALHKRLSKTTLSDDISNLVKQLPKRKLYIHLMVVHYAIHQAEKGIQHNNA